jgi:hypothetical protein
MPESRPAGPKPGHYEIPDEPLQAQEKFWSQWGEQAGFSREQFNLIWADASEQYIDLAHHNFGHAQQVLWDAMCLVDMCEANGVKVNRKALIGAALFHDGGYYQRALQDDPTSKEVHAAMMFEAYARQRDYGLEPEDIHIGAHAIRSTESTRRPIYIEDKILIRADIMNVSGDYETSVEPVTKSLLEEARMLEGDDGQTPSRVQFMHRSIKVIASYLIHDLSLGSFDTKDSLEKSVRNLLRMIRETATEESRSTADLVKGLGSHAVTNLFHRARSDSGETPSDRD